MREHGIVLRFLIFSLSLCIVWFLVYDFWLSLLDNWLSLKIVHSTVHFLSFIGYNADANGIMVQIDGADTVFVYHACNGMVLMALFTGFIVAFPGPIIKKLFFIPIGLLLIYILNILRVSALALNAHHFSYTVDFNHKYTFTIIVYAAIFVLWMIWVKRYSGVGKHVKAQNPKSQATSY
ncbi:exosortase X [Pontibacter virosus]|uniref:Exosortase family protein XrtF n=1 Tax=Pontibacter virosus TaxID=1765052 RepID=A0A2U1AQJ6_9BACT|nr:archaeosortase/exosortase family protein [Pontibacter virosus]PVY38692.1 exosortase family protein XrtF [Pontibacter virosus]